MSGETGSIVSENTVDEVSRRLKGRTTMIVGGPGTGKTRLARSLVERLAGPGQEIGLVSADMGQPWIGVPTCLGLALSEPLPRPSALWFIGDVAPRGNLLPTVVGTARLVQHARAAGAQTVVIDTTGLVSDALGRALKYHKALASNVDGLLAIQRGAELEEMLALVAKVVPEIHRLRPTPQARDRSVAERRAYRRERYEEHFRDGEVLDFDAAALVGRDWTAVHLRGQGYPAPGTVVGLIDRAGFCRGLGLIEAAQPGRLLVYTAWKERDVVGSLQIGKVRLNRHEGFSEVH